MKELYHRLFEELPCYVSVQDRDLRLIAVNSMFRRDFGGKPGAYCYQIYKGRAGKCADCPVKQTFRDGKSHASEEIVTRKDGEDVNVIVYTSPVRNPNGKIDAVVETRRHY
ncbi:MAG: PAS domain-containing protein [Candidatus Latescibacteria bacterium]|nr:PAS domain-containing protein [Candidatus Latescibacterota bacterium]NIO55283.1 PAS domain-containing protein [Candidatus Latescibacterota bacterium]